MLNRAQMSTTFCSLYGGIRLRYGEIFIPLVLMKSLLMTFKKKKRKSTKREDTEKRSQRTIKSIQRQNPISQKTKGFADSQKTNTPPKLSPQKPPSQRSSADGIVAHQHQRNALQTTTEKTAIKK
ncbi:Uncharacterized protein TCM_034914 [Theobroma cacao]|uniref:Uncharacterized protein n=1 Tax=Theobroma cacao TaxID=3641 RepID=A0A061FF96_THECC|nr:Uncharacterized protein TCM_034914 [Theobroma cacao]